ncbi:MAG: Thymidylate kinase [Candidatus Collierbacteria bacterium GW2011_GWF2_42_51]|nr:MAG: Thymidylate kinase [Candidatus Collierbacteria bacterium GW2011_GWF2_42_51]
MTENKKPLLVIEGGSGSGKTTAIKGIREYLQDWKFFREPGGTDYGELLRTAVQETHGIEIDPMAAFLTYSASRANLINTRVIPILEGLREGKGVLLDRYWFSSYAYQSSEKVDKAIIVAVSKIATKGLMPDLVLHYDLAPELAYDMKELAFHSRVRDAYLELSVKYPDFWRVIDVSQSIPKVLDDSLVTLKEFGLI